MSLQIVILAAGKGTRMGGEIPKVLLPLHSKPVVQYLLDEVKPIEQLTPPVLVVGFKEELVKQTLGPNYVYVTQFDQKGTAHAVMSTQSVVKAENIIVLYGDMPFTTKESLEKLSDLHLSNNAMISMFTTILPDFEDNNEAFFGYGRILRDIQGRIIQIQEVRDCNEEQKKITEVNPGIYMFNSKWVFEQLKRVNSQNAQHEFYLTDIVELAIQDGHEVYSLPIAPEEVYGINTPAHLDYARKLV